MYSRFVWATLLVTKKNGGVKWRASGIGTDMAELKREAELVTASGDEVFWAMPYEQMNTAQNRAETRSKRFI
jgi:hypothetical protein